jgi:hypothetical protein
MYKISQYDSNEACSLRSIAMILRSDSFGGPPLILEEILRTSPKDRDSCMKSSHP